MIRVHLYAIDANLKRSPLGTVSITKSGEATCDTEVVAGMWQVLLRRTKGDTLKAAVMAADYFSQSYTVAEVSVEEEGNAGA